MANNIRRQLTLFADEKDAIVIEKFRQQFNPVQRALINCHVTLCRENEIENIEQVINNLSRLTVFEIAMEFGKPIRFDNGKGLLLPVKAGHIEFRELRKQILQGIIDQPAIQEPHITLMHPRNATCTGEIFEQAEKTGFPARLVFKKISLIEKTGNEPWKTLQDFEPGDKPIRHVNQ